MSILYGAACTSTTPLPNGQPAPESTLSLWVFRAPHDARGDSSIGAHAAQLDAMIDGWIQLDSLTDQPSQLYPDERVAVSATMEHVAVVTTFSGQRFHADIVPRLAASAGARNLAASRTAALIARGRYTTAWLDFEDQSKADLPAVLRVMRAFADTLHVRGVRVVVALPGADTTAYPASPFLSFADFIAVALYDEHWPGSAPGPVATPAWTRRVLARRVADAGSARLIAVLPAYSYAWRNNQPGELLGFEQARQLASEANVDLARDPASRSLHAVQPGSWELWLTDAVLLRALEAEVRALGVRRVALRRIGLEDPAIWPAPVQTIIKSR